MTRSGVLTWEQLTPRRQEPTWFKSTWETHRTKVPGGWLVLVRGMMTEGQSVTFYPDPDHRWTGGSLP